MVGLFWFFFWEGNYYPASVLCVFFVSVAYDSESKSPYECAILFKMSSGPNSGIAGFWTISVCQYSWLLGVHEIGTILGCCLRTNVFLLTLLCFQCFLLEIRGGCSPLFFKFPLILLLNRNRSFGYQVSVLASTNTSKETSLKKKWWWCGSTFLYRADSAREGMTCCIIWRSCIAASISRNFQMYMQEWNRNLVLDTLCHATSHYL